MRGGDQATFLSADQITEPLVREAAFALAAGGVSDVLSAGNGVHLLKVLERQETPNGPQVKLADVFLPREPSPETISTLREQVAEIREQAMNTPLEQVAGEHSLPVRETPPFGEGSFVPGLGSAPELAAFAFRAQPGAIGVPLETAEGWVVARLKERRPERVPELAEITERVRTETIDSLKLAQAVQVAEGILEQARGGQSLAAIAQAEPRATADQTEPFPRLGFAKGIGNDAGVIGPIFAAAETGLVPKAVKGRTAAFVVRVLERTTADRTTFDSTKEGLRRSLVQRRQSQIFNEWLADLKKRADVKDYRWGVGES
jgi:peptidyl-prolyl cis-trans isomerase D